MAILNILNISGSLFIPYFIVFFLEPTPSKINFNLSKLHIFFIVPALGLLTLSVILTLKLISHAHVMSNVYHIIERLRTISNKNPNENIPENELSPEVYFYFGI